MKLYNYLLFVLLSATASLHAMERVELVQYDPDWHSDGITRIFKKEFSTSLAHQAIGAPWLDSPSKVIVAECDNVPVGFAIYSHENPLVADAFRDVCPSSEKSIKACKIDYLAVGKEHKKQGIGSKLMQHIEKLARANDDDIMSLVAINDSKPFYECKHMFIPTTPGCVADYMAKPLNEETSKFLARIIAARELNGSENFVLHPDAI